MRARIIHTKFYESERVLSLSTLSRWLYMYYLTCSGIGLTGAFKWSDSKTMFETAIKPKDLQQCKNELTASNLVFYHDSWVVIPDTSEKTGYNNGDNLTSKAFTKEFESLPDEIKQLLNPPSRGMQGGYIPQEIRNKKSEIEKGIVKGKSSTGRAVAEHIISVFNQATSKNYSPTDKRCKLIADRLRSYPSEQLEKAARNIALSPFHMGKNDRNWMADPDWLFRNDENVDKMLNLEIKQEKKEPVRLGYKALMERTYATTE